MYPLPKVKTRSELISVFQQPRLSLRYAPSKRNCVIQLSTLSTCQCVLAQKKSMAQACGEEEGARNLEPKWVSCVAVVRSSSVIYLLLFARIMISSKPGVQFDVPPSACWGGGRK